MASPSLSAAFIYAVVRCDEASAPLKRGGGGPEVGPHPPPGQVDSPLSGTADVLPSFTRGFLQSCLLAVLLIFSR